MLENARGIAIAGNNNRSGSCLASRGWHDETAVEVASVRTRKNASISLEADAANDVLNKPVTNSYGHSWAADLAILSRHLALLICWLSSVSEQYLPTICIGFAHDIE